MVVLKEMEEFDLSATFLSGQCFRWKQEEEGVFLGVVRNKVLRVKKEGTDVIIEGITPEEFDGFYQEYFDLHRNYREIKEILRKDEYLAKAIDFTPGMRMLHQDFWETLCSFILSQNNNIKRISTIIETLCKEFGTPLTQGRYGFPSAQRIAKLSLEEIEVIKSGFRGKYLLDAAQKVDSGEICEDKLKEMTLEEGIIYLTKIKGVGVKVAECVLLYGGRKLQAFPKDVWILRVLDLCYPKGLPSYVLPHAGIAQLYLFHYIRYSGELTGWEEPPKKRKPSLNKRKSAPKDRDRKIDEKRLQNKKSS